MDFFYVTKLSSLWKFLQIPIISLKACFVELKKEWETCINFFQLYTIAEILIVLFRMLGSPQNNEKFKTRSLFYCSSLLFSPINCRYASHAVFICYRAIPLGKSLTYSFYWNYIKYTFVFSNPSWSQTGLVTVSVSVTETVCHTNHFTNFAVLMRVGTGKFNVSMLFLRNMSTHRPRQCKPSHLLSYTLASNR